MLVADPVYSPTRILTEDYLKDFNIKTVFYNPHDLNTLKNNITKKTKLKLFKVLLSIFQRHPRELNI